MAIRIYNSVTNAHLLDKLKLTGIQRMSNGGKDERCICHCGWVGKETHCPVCGNDDFPMVSGNTWSYISDFIVKVGDYSFNITTSGVQVVADALSSKDDTMTKSFDFSIGPVVLATINEKDISLNRITTSITPSKDVLTWILDNVDSIPDNALAEQVKDAIKVTKILFNGDVSNIIRVYPLFYYNATRWVISEESAKKYTNFWRSILSRFSWGSGKFDRANTSMRQLMENIGIPYQLDTYCQSSFFELGYYYGGRNEPLIKQTDFNAMPESLQRTIVSAAEHNIIGTQTIREIVNWSTTESEERCEILAKFIKKNGMQFMDRVFVEFGNLLSVVVEHGLPDEDVLNQKKIAMAEASALLEKRKFKDSRIDAFINIFDVDPALGLSLLGSKAKLKADEQKAVYG